MKSDALCGYQVTESVYNKIGLDSRTSNMLVNGCLTQTRSHLCRNRSLRNLETTHVKALVAKPPNQPKDATTLSTGRNISTEAFKFRFDKFYNSKIIQYRPLTGRASFTNGQVLQFGPLANERMV